MRRITLIMFALFCATTLFTGCSDDDGDGPEGGNGNGAGNGGSGVTVLSKKISKIVEAYSDYSQKDTTYYKYDSEGRLSTIIEGEKKETSNITYTSNNITITEPGSTTPQTITLKDGRATGSIEYYNNYRFVYTLGYSSGYISNMSFAEDEKKDGEWVNETPTSAELKISNGNLQSVKMSNKDESSMTFEYGNTPNNTNIDLWEFIFDFENMSLLCVTGTRFKNLPSKAISKYQYEGKTIERTETYTYEINAENYVTKMTVVREEIGENSHTYSYTITYE